MRDAPRRRRWSWGFSFLTYIFPPSLYIIWAIHLLGLLYTCVWGEAESKVTHKRILDWLLRPFKSKSTREKGHSIYCFTFWILLLGYTTLHQLAVCYGPFNFRDEPTNRNTESIGSNMKMPNSLKKRLVACVYLFHTCRPKLMVY